MAPTMKKQGSLFMGICGLVLPYKNRQEYPPRFEGKSRIEDYGALFNSIEINSTLYKLPRLTTLASKRQCVGDEFRFTFKLWKQISHSPALNFEQRDLEQYFEIIAGADTNSGCILVQFPPSVKSPQFENVKLILSSLQEINQNKWAVAVEFRNASWYTKRTYDLRNRYNVALVYHDKNGNQTPQQELDANLIYLRFHGPDGNYKGSYDQDFLYEYASYIND